jgi:hypothetical protein
VVLRHLFGTKPIPLVQDFKACFLRSLFAIAPPHPSIEPVYIPGGTGATIFCFVIYSAFVVSNEGNKKNYYVNALYLILHHGQTNLTG